MNLPVIPEIKSVTDLRYQTADIIKLLDQNKPVVITRENDTVAVMFSPKFYHQLLVIFEQMQDREDVRKLEKAIEKGSEFTDFSIFDKKQRKKLQIA